MFTYCFNNPVNLDDSEGNWPKWAKKVAIGVAVIAAAAIGMRWKCDTPKQRMDLWPVQSREP